MFMQLPCLLMNCSAQAISAFALENIVLRYCTLDFTLTSMVNSLNWLFSTVNVWSQKYFNTLIDNPEKKLKLRNV